MTSVRVKIKSLRLVKNTIEGSSKSLLLLFLSKNWTFDNKLIWQTVLQCVYNSLTTLSELSDIHYILEVPTVFLQKVFNFVSCILGFKGLNFSLVNGLFLASSFKEKLCIVFIVRLVLVVLKGFGMNDSLSLVENKFMVFLII